MASGFGWWLVIKRPVCSTWERFLIVLKLRQWTTVQKEERRGVKSWQHSWDQSPKTTQSREEDTSYETRLALQGQVSYLTQANPTASPLWEQNTKLNWNRWWVVLKSKDAKFRAEYISVSRSSRQTCVTYDRIKSSTASQKVQWPSATEDLIDESLKTIWFQSFCFPQSRIIGDVRRHRVWHVLFTLCPNFMLKTNEEHY